jgi:hypothetical protein
LAFLIALANETLERRIDSCLNQGKTEESYEDSTREFFRQLSKEVFKPQFTDWLQESDVSVNYGAEVNKMKAAIGLPMTPVEGYSRSELKRWIVGLAKYDGFREEGYSHVRARRQVQLNRTAREEG